MLLHACVGPQGRRIKAILQSLAPVELCKLKEPLAENLARSLAPAAFWTLVPWTALTAQCFRGDIDSNVIGSGIMGDCRAAGGLRARVLCEQAEHVGVDVCVRVDAEGKVQM